MSVDHKFTYIQSITPAMKNVNIQFIVLDVGPPRHTKDGQDVRTARVADASGSVDLAVWNELGECIFPGDICRLRSGYSVVRKGCLSVACGKNGEIIKIGEFTMVYAETPNVSEYNPSHLAESGVPRKRSPPGGDEDKSGNDGDKTGPPQKQARSNGQSGNNQSASSSGFIPSNGSNRTSSQTSSDNSLPDGGAHDKNGETSSPRLSLGESSGAVNVTQAGYRRMEASRSTSTAKHYAPKYSTRNESTVVATQSNTGFRSSFPSDAFAQNSFPPCPPPSFFQRFPPPPLFPNMRSIRPDGFQTQRIGGTY